jgi:hypothetical protein
MQEGSSSTWSVEKIIKDFYGIHDLKKKNIVNRILHTSMPGTTTWRQRAQNIVGGKQFRAMSREWSQDKGRAIGESILGIMVATMNIAGVLDFGITSVGGTLTTRAVERVADAGANRFASKYAVSRLEQVGEHGAYVEQILRDEGGVRNVPESFLSMRTKITYQKLQAPEGFIEQNNMGDIFQEQHPTISGIQPVNKDIATQYQTQLQATKKDELRNYYESEERKRLRQRNRSDARRFQGTSFTPHLSEEDIRQQAQRVAEEKVDTYKYDTWYKNAVNKNIVRITDKDKNIALRALQITAKDKDRIQALLDISQQVQAVMSRITYAIRGTEMAVVGTSLGISLKNNSSNVYAS